MQTPLCPVTSMSTGRFGGQGTGSSNSNLTARQELLSKPTLLFTSVQASTSSSWSKAPTHTSTRRQEYTHTSSAYLNDRSRHCLYRVVLRVYRMCSLSPQGSTGRRGAPPPTPLQVVSQVLSYLAFACLVFNFSSGCPASPHILPYKFVRNTPYSTYFYGAVRSTLLSWACMALWLLGSELVSVRAAMYNKAGKSPSLRDR
ncbi:hypothetical protein HDV57DRAFT_281033 [Trichoderma longibrachiatum]